MKGKRNPKKAMKNSVSLGAVIRENLPFPVVYYPNHYGTFFAFAKDESSQATLCLCSKPAIENFIQLKQKNPIERNADPSRMAVFDSFFFPGIIANTPLKSKHDPIEDLCFAQGLCHRCNLITPSLRYCHEMYGVEFIQHFGWYYNQAYLRLGIYPMSLSYLVDVCPLEYQDDIESLEKAKEDFQKENNRLIEIVRGPKRNDIDPDEITYWSNVKVEEANDMITLRKIAAKKERSFTKKIENIVRKEFGFKNVGEGWVSETILYQIVQRIFIEKEILRHHRPDWLEGLELDIFLPSLKLAFEYQGQQHFNPIGIWGGATGLQNLRCRDERKAKLCDNYGIDLIKIDYTEPLTEDYIFEILENKGYLNPNNRYIK